MQARVDRSRSARAGGAPRACSSWSAASRCYPALVELVQRVRATGIAPVISVTTNGLKLGEMTDAFWQAVDALTISRYPKPSLSPDLVAHIERRPRASTCA